MRGRPFAGGAGHTAGPFTVYVANEAGNTVTPIRAASNTAGRPIKVGPAPALIAISNTISKEPSSTTPTREGFETCIF